ncbi:MAG TPA: prenyltransferase/squalene oxidase repeat-containing protein, partial [Myxococcales bacterium]
MVSRILAAVVGLTVALTVSTAAADTSHVVVESHDGGNYSKTGDLLADNEARAQVARKFYATHADSYDFLVVFPTFDADFGSDVGGIHWTVRNSEAGINQPVTNLGAQFGSPSRLKGFVDMAQLMPSAGPTATDQALDVVAHEVAHQWSGAVRYKGGDGAVRTDLIGRDSAHWSFFLNSDASVLYGSNWRANGDGTFTATEGRKRYSALDLYLMGFLSAAEVPAFTLLHPDSSVGFRATDLPLQVSTTIKATPETVTISQVIAAEGERVPSVEGATKVFRAAFIILSAPGSQPTEDQLAKVDSIRRAWANHFFFLTRGRGVMETDLVELPPGTLSSSPSVNAGLDYLLSRQLADGSWSDSSATSVRDTQTALEALAVFPADPRSPVAMTRAASYLGVATLSDTDAIARAILGLVAAHSPTGSALGLLALPADPFELLQPGASSLSKGYSDCVIDAILAGKAKLQAGVEAETVTATTAFALAQQNVDGGWSFTVGGPSRVEPTAHVLDYLSGLPRTNDVSAACGRALQFIESRKNSSGAFADDLLAPATTARSVLALQNWERLNST